MPMSPEERRLTEYMRDHCYENYVIKAGTSGGFVDGYVTFVLGDYKKHPDAYPTLAILAKCARADWARKAPWERDDDDADEYGNLFVLGLEEVSLPKGITIPDPTVRGGFRRVHRTLASIDQHREQTLMRLRNGARVAAAAEKEMRANDWATNQAKGDRSQKIIDFASKKPKAA